MRPGWRPPRSRPLLQERGGAKKTKKQKIIIIIILNSIRKIIWEPQWRSSVGRLRVAPYHMDALPLLQLLILNKRKRKTVILLDMHIHSDVMHQSAILKLLRMA